MKLSFVLASSLAVVGSTQAQFSTAHTHASQSRPTQPRIANPHAPAPLVGGSDSCTTPDVITGTGTFAFDNSTATTAQLVWSLGARLPGPDDLVLSDGLGQPPLGRTAN